MGDYLLFLSVYASFFVDGYIGHLVEGFESIFI
jgi:hypothetical protein